MKTHTLKRTDRLGPTSAHARTPDAPAHAQERALARADATNTCSLARAPSASAPVRIGRADRASAPVRIGRADRASAPVRIGRAYWPRSPPILHAGGHYHNVAARFTHSHHTP